MPDLARSGRSDPFPIRQPTVSVDARQCVMLAPATELTGHTRSGHRPYHGHWRPRTANATNGFALGAERHYPAHQGNA